MPLKNTAYANFCEELWRDWLDDTRDVPAFVRANFDLDAAPEPYLSFGVGSDPLVALTTNPGATMPHQTRAAVRAGKGPLNAEMDYAAAAMKLADYYETHLTGPARRRIASLQALATPAGYDGVLQVEACPFHSRALPAKARLLTAIAEEGCSAVMSTSCASSWRTAPS